MGKEMISARIQTAILFAVFILIMTVGTNPAYGDSSHHETTVLNSRIEKTSAEAIAMSQLSFDWSTQALQFSGGVGVAGDDSALSLGLGKRFGQVLLNGSVSGDSMGAGFTLRLK